MHNKSYKFLKLFLIFITILVGLQAVYGGAQLIADPSGASVKIDQYLSLVTFAKNYFWLGIILLTAVGVAQLFCAFLLIINYNYAAVATILAASILLIWKGVQLVYIGWFSYSTFYTILGVIELGAGIWFLIILNKIKKSNAKKD